MESEEKKVILFETLCKRESKDGYFIMKGIRTKSDIEAGIGYSNIIGGDGVFGNLIEQNVLMLHLILKTQYKSLLNVM